jgi:3-oxoacyl-[acyl-carrier protein] reductase
MRGAFRGNSAGIWRVAVITGANQGLGLGIARAYVQKGASVALCARDLQLLERARAELSPLLGRDQKVIIQAADVSNPTAVQQLQRVVLEIFPRVHILVNNAGIQGSIGLLENTDWFEWTRAIEINLYGSVLMSRAFLPHFKAHGYGKIIQLSGGGATKPMPRLSSYAASKAAVVRFSETLAEEVRQYGIDINSVAPGALNTRMLEELLKAGPDKAGKDYYSEAIKQKDKGGAPLETAIALTVFLGSAASDGITGKLLSALWDPWRDLPGRVAELNGSDIYTLRRIVPEDRGRKWSA